MSCSLSRETETESSPRSRSERSSPGPRRGDSQSLLSARDPTRCPGAGGEGGGEVKARTGGRAAAGLQVGVRAAGRREAGGWGVGDATGSGWGRGKRGGEGGRVSSRAPLFAAACGRAPTAGTPGRAAAPVLQAQFGCGARGSAGG